MSRVGQKPIEIPQNVEVKQDADRVIVKGPKGELFLDLPNRVSIKQEDNMLKVEVAQRRGSKSPAIWGLYRALLANLVQGVTEGFEKKLEIEGVGYKGEVSGNKLVLNLGYSHPVEMEIPEGLDVKVEKSTISVSGADKQQVGQFAADVRSKRKPEPYKGKGIRYAGEHIRRKAGKKAAAE